LGPLFIISFLSIFHLFPPSVQLRYRHTTTAKAYGKMVWNHLKLIEQRLGQSEPIRQGWLRLIKEIAEYLMAARHANKTKGDSNGSEKN
jgi:hypothetical protein